MTNHPTANESWLTKYYFTRAAFSFAWLAAAVSVAAHSSSLAAILLVCYPLWDALANLVDAKRSGGLAANRPQAFNVLVSVAIAVGICVALPNMNHVLGVFGFWAILSGVLQLGAGLRRRRQYGAQWAMMLSGAQSALAGAVFVYQAQSPVVPSIATVAGYAGFGAFYFLVSAISLSITAKRRQQA